MRDGIDGRADEPGDDAAHLQPLTAAQIKAQQSAENLDRLLGDVDLLLRLQLSGYADKEWEPGRNRVRSSACASASRISRSSPSGGEVAVNGGLGAFIGEVAPPATNFGGPQASRMRPCPP